MKYMEIWYNNDEKEIEENKYIMMLNLQPEELENLSKKDRMVLKYMSEIQIVNEEEESREYMSAEEDNRKIENSIRDEYIEKGLEQGKKESSILIAKKMKEDNIDIETILKYTGLKKEDVKKL